MLKGSELVSICLAGPLAAFRHPHVILGEVQGGKEREAECIGGRVQKQVWKVEEKINMSKSEETWKKGKEREKRRK